MPHLFEVKSAKEVDDEITPPQFATNDLNPEGPMGDLVRLTVPFRADASSRIVARKKRSLVFLEPSQVWAFEAAQRLTYVHSQAGVFDLDLSLVEIEAALPGWLARVHRRWLVSLSQVRELERVAGESTLFVGSILGEQRSGVTVPVARDRAQALRDMLLANATGVRRT
jgi:two-component system response regulator LytT